MIVNETNEVDYVWSIIIINKNKLKEMCKFLLKLILTNFVIASEEQNSRRVEVF